MVQLSFQEWTQQMKEMLDARKRGDSAFRDKDFRTAIDNYSQVRIHGTSVEEYTSLCWERAVSCLRFRVNPLFARKFELIISGHCYFLFGVLLWLSSPQKISFVILFLIFHGNGPSLSYRSHIFVLVLRGFVN